MLQYVLTTLGIIVLVAVAVFHVVFYYDLSWLRRRSDCKKTDLIPGPKTLPYFGNGLLFYLPQEKLLKQIFRLCKEYGPTFRMWLLGGPEVFITDPEDIEVILSSTGNISKSRDYKFLHPWLGTGLLTSAGTKWHERRKLLTPAFHFKILEDYLKVFNNNSHILVEKLGEKVGEPFVDITSYVTLCTLDIICETAMGVQFRSQSDGEAEYIKAVKRSDVLDALHETQSEICHFYYLHQVLYISRKRKMTKVVVKRLISPWLYKDYICKLTPLGREQTRLLQILHGFTEQVIKERREEYKSIHKSQKENMPRKRRRLAFLDLLIEMSEKEGLLSDADIREEVDTFMFEGHDTTSVGISWAMYLLGSHPEVQEKVVEELKGIFGDSEREATYEDLQQMKYLEQVIKEALRLYPSVPVVSRKLDVDVKIKNYTIPAGTLIPIVTFFVHRNPEVFPNPEDFNPDNFLPEKVLNRHPFAYIPFSAGPRNCIGQRFAMLEEKVVLSSVLRKLRLQSLDKREDVPPLLDLVLRPQNGIRIKISPR